MTNSTSFWTRFRYPKAWFALAALIILILTNLSGIIGFEFNMPDDWDIVFDMFLAVLVAIGIIGDPTKKFTWADFWAGFHSPVTKATLWTLFTYVLINWVFVWLNVDAQLVRIVTAVIAFISESYGIKNNPLTPTAP